MIMHPSNPDFTISDAGPAERQPYKNSRPMTKEEEEDFWDKQLEMQSDLIP